MSHGGQSKGCRGPLSRHGAGSASASLRPPLDSQREKQVLLSGIFTTLYSTGGEVPLQMHSSAHQSRGIWLPLEAE